MKASSEDPKLVRELGAAAVRGFQGNGLTNPIAVLACAKHFVGDGGTCSYGFRTEDGRPRPRRYARR